MNKILAFLVSVFLCINCAAYASDIEVVPTMRSKSNAQDKVWVGTFQLVWNDFMNKFVHNLVRFREGTPEFVWDLNAQTFTTNDISDKCYYKMAGKANSSTRRQILKGIKKKFHETSDLIDKMDLTQRSDKFIIYAMLYKNFEFIAPFDKLGKSAFGDGTPAEYFGIGSKSERVPGRGVRVVFYNNPSDYAVLLYTKEEEEVYLYKNDTNKTFSELYTEMLKKEEVYTGSNILEPNDELKVPNLKFFKEKSFDGLANRRVMGTNIIISQAMETVNFEMNNKGGKLKSEAGMTFLTTSYNPDVKIPKLFYFDDTFILFLKEKGNKSPYFALRVNNIENFQ